MTAAADGQQEVSVSSPLCLSFSLVSLLPVVVFVNDCLLPLKLGILEFSLQGSQVSLPEERDTCSWAVWLRASEIHMGQSHVIPSVLINRA